MNIIQKKVDSFQIIPFYSTKEWNILYSETQSYSASVESASYFDKKNLNLLEFEKKHNNYFLLERLFYKPNSAFYFSINEYERGLFRNLSGENKVIFLPNDLIGEGIKPGSLVLSSSNTSIYIDDGFGNILNNNEYNKNYTKIIFSNYSNTSSFFNDWENRSGGGEVAIESEGLKVGNSVTPDQAWFVYKHNIKYDSSRRYKFRIKARKTKDSNTASFFAGFEGRDKDDQFVNYVGTGSADNSAGNQHYFVASDYHLDPDYTIFTGYLTGYGSPNGTSWSTNHTNAKAHVNVKYLRPLFICNYQNKVATTYVEYFEFGEDISYLLTSNLVSGWLFDEGALYLNSSDSLFNFVNRIYGKYDFKLYNGKVSFDNDLLYNLVFNGSSSYGVIDDKNELNFKLDDFAYSFWLKLPLSQSTNYNHPTGSGLNSFNPVFSRESERKNGNKYISNGLVTYNHSASVFFTNRSSRDVYKNYISYSDRGYTYANHITTTLTTHSATNVQDPFGGFNSTKLVANVDGFPIRFGLQLTCSFNNQGTNPTYDSNNNPSLKPGSSYCLSTYVYYHSEFDITFTSSLSFPSNPKDFFEIMQNSASSTNFDYFGHYILNPFGGHTFYNNSVYTSSFSFTNKWRRVYANFTVPPTSSAPISDVNTEISRIYAFYTTQWNTSSIGTSSINIFGTQLEEIPIGYTTESFIPTPYQSVGTPSRVGKLHYIRGNSVDSSFPYLNFFSAKDLNDNAFHHVVIQKTGSKFEMYIDNIKNNDITIPSNRLTQFWSKFEKEFYFGKDTVHYLNYLSGSLDRFMIYNKALNDTEINSLYKEPYNQNVIGNVFYRHGVIVINKYTDSIFSSNTDSLSFKSISKINEYKVEFTKDPNEFNFSLNKTLYEGPTMSLITDIKNNLSVFSPYITTFGLYNDNNDLLVVGKFKKPIFANLEIPLKFSLNFDI